MPETFIERLIYSAIVWCFLLLGALFAWRVPDWQAPDEPAHYNYIAQVANGELLPVIEMGDWNNSYINEIKANDFIPSVIDELDTVQYENHQPPLYYWLATPIFILTDGNLFAVRMVSVLLATIMLMLSYSITKEIFCEHTHLALVVMLLIGFLPQNLHILASVNNDALAGVMIAITILLCVQYLKDESRSAWGLGLAVGIIFITKTTAYFMAGVVVIVIAMRWWQQSDNRLANSVKHYLQFGIPATIFALIYWGRNILTYGFPDFLGLQAHDAIVVGQQRRSEFVALNGSDVYWREAFLTTFHSFWGQFGWMEARLGDAIPIAIYFIIGLIFLALTGLLLYAWRNISKRTDSVSGKVWILLGFVMFFALAQYVYYNITFVQFQGRYIFAGIIPFAIGMVLGVDTWRGMLLKHEYSKWLTVLLFSVFIPLDLYLIWRVIPCAVGCI